MGMFDYITCELPMPDGREVEKDSFQTKSLWCCMDHFTITVARRLIWHKRPYSRVSEDDSWRPEHLGDLDMDYHGDIEIHGEAKDGMSVSYVVRFTHGTVEWIRPLNSLPELHTLWLMERGW